MFIYKLNDKGVSTIEACIVIPMCFGVSMLLIWLGIFFYNKNLLSESASRAVVYGTEHSELSNEEIKEKVEEKLNECINEGNVLIENVTYTVTIDFNTITVHIKGDVNVPGEILLGGIYRENNWEIEVIKRSPRLHNSSFIRTVDLVQKGLDGG